MSIHRIIPALERRQRALRKKAASTHIQLKGKHVLLTGGTQGIGAATVEAFLLEGAHVLAVARHRPEGFPEERFIAADLSTVEGCATLGIKVGERFGTLDVLVHVVGGSSAPGGTVPLA